MLLMIKTSLRPDIVINAQHDDGYDREPVPYADIFKAIYKWLCMLLALRVDSEFRTPPKSLTALPVAAVTLLSGIRQTSMHSTMEGTKVHRAVKGNSPVLVEMVITAASPCSLTS